MDTETHDGSTETEGTAMTFEDLQALRPIDDTAAAARDSRSRIAAAKSAAAAVLQGLNEQRGKILLTHSYDAILERDQSAAGLTVWIEQLTALDSAVAEQEVGAVRRERLAELQRIAERANVAAADANARTNSGYAALVKKVAEFAAIPDEAQRLIHEYWRALAANADLAADLPPLPKLTAFRSFTGIYWHGAPLKEIIWLPELEGVSKGINCPALHFQPNRRVIR